MSRETHKANRRRKKSKMFYARVFAGKGIDIGCGSDVLNKKVFKNITSIEGFDQTEGNAENISDYREKEKYDFVYSSNCLEHMENPEIALFNWFKLVKPGGYLVFTVPDEDLYEQGHFPSKYNPDHKWTFTIYKTKSWSPKSINITDLFDSLDGCQVLQILTVDTKYDYTKKNIDQTRGKSEAFIEVVLQKTNSN